MLRFILSILSGLMMAAAWPPSPFYILFLIGLLPLILAVFASPNGAQAYLNALISYFIFNVITMSWFSHISDDPLSWTLIYLAYILIPAGQSLPILFSFLISKRSSFGRGLLSFPIIYMSYEIFHSHWDLSYTWVHYGLGFSESPFFLSMYRWIGQEGGAFFILSLNTVLAACILMSDSSIWIKRTLGMSAVLLVIPFIAYLSEPSYVDQGKLKIAIFQPKTDPNQVYTNNTIDSNYNLLNAAVNEQLTEDVQLIACPEGFFKNFHDNPVIMNDPYRHSVIKKLLKLSEEKNIAIISGVIALKLYFTRNPPTITARLKNDSLYYDTYNAVMLIEPNGKIQWRSKTRLVAFTERVPFIQFWKSLEGLHMDFTQSAGSYASEENSNPFQYQNLVIAPIICYESLYPSVVNTFIEKNANLIMEFSNENWSGTTNKGQLQHESYATVNAAQFGRQYVRSTFNKGSSVFIETGKDLYENEPLNKEDFVVMEARVKKGRTFYSRFRKYWMSMALMAVFIVLLTLIKP